MSSRIYTADKEIKGDIISIVMEISGFEFKKALRKMHEILGLNFILTTYQQKNEYDPLAIFKNVKSFNCTNVQELKPLNENALQNKNYLKLPHISLVKEGIVPSVQNEFGVMYDIKSQRILFPHRHWSTGDLLGIFGRTTIEQWDILGIPKYFGVIPYSKSLNLYGLYENYKSIQNNGMVLVVEGEKSTQKLKSYGFPYAVALGGHELSQEQIKILISLDVDIIFALDKDVDQQVSVDMCKNFKSIRNAYYIYDKYNLLDNKDAPIDKGIKIFQYLLKYKRKVV